MPTDAGATIRLPARDDPGSQLVAIVASHRPGDHLAACLESLAAQELAAVVVDDGSPAARVTTIARTFPRVRTIRSAANRGFAASVNAAIAELLCAAPPAHRPEWVLLLNDDAALEPGFLAAVTPHLGGATAWSMLGPLRLRDDDPLRIDSAGLTLRDDGGGGDWLADEPLTRAPARAVEILGPSAGAALYRLDLLAGLGGFEASFWAYFEDLELALRARAAGARALLIPDARVRHRGGATTRARAYRRLVCLERNRVRTVVRHFPSGLAVQCIARAVRGAAARAARAPATGGSGTAAPRGSQLAWPLAMAAHLEGWARAALAAPRDARWRARRAAVLAPAELHRWMRRR